MQHALVSKEMPKNHFAQPNYKILHIIRYLGAVKHSYIGILGGTTGHSSLTKQSIYKQGYLFYSVLFLGMDRVKKDICIFLLACLSFPHYFKIRF